MICRGVDSRGCLIMDSNVCLHRGETFVGLGEDGVEHVLKVLKVEFFDHVWYWCHRHTCKVIDDQFDGMYDLGGDDVQ